NWTVFSKTPAGESVTISDPHALNPVVTITGDHTIATLRLTVTDSNSCANSFTSDDVILAVTPGPSCDFSSSSTGVDNINHTVIRGGRYVFTGAGGVDSYSWAITSVPASPEAAILGATNQQAVTVNLPPDGLNSFTLALTVAKGGCSNTCS